MNKSMRLFAVAAAVVLGVFAGSSPSFGTESTARTATTDKIDTAAVQASMAAHNNTLTQGEAQRLGVRPDTVYIDTPQVQTLHAAVHSAHRSAKTITTSSSAVHPDSASGCNFDVCIEVIGSGLQVDNWNTFAYPTGYQCSFAAYWEDGEIAFTGEEICSDGLLETFASDFDGLFDDGEQVCNTWVAIPGKPCETIHS